MLHMKRLHSKETRFPRFDKILVIQPIAEVYDEGNERQLCQEIDSDSVQYPSFRNEFSSFCLCTRVCVILRIKFFFFKLELT